MTTQEQAVKRAAVTAALQKLPLLPDVENTIALAVEEILLWTRSREVENRFLNLGRSGVDKELAVISRLADAMSAAIANAHQPTHATLSDLGVNRSDIFDFCSRISAACRTANTSALPIKVPRRKTAGVPQAVAISLAHYFQLLTGKPAAISTFEDGKAGGRFLRLVEEVFEALPVDASAESCAREAVRRKRVQRKMANNSF
ncbi:hypothetical protein MKK75_02630 [Methylobacterium sp. J-030]|uniref:hypothetical protein n=1 Tax=Methylobacterium sp. J-030 TaxID=2836627 RepID=UPI001FB8E3A5|nr:hypothetical protein [Methylobacterium sp. J-030]MCJ2067709.1 hypothetical protein [Methylobacterium sp. J-030]